MSDLFEFHPVRLTLDKGDWGEGLGSTSLMHACETLGMKGLCLLRVLL